VSESTPETAAPVLRDTLAADLRRLGVPAGGLVLAHVSLSALGWVVGGPVAVVQALLDVLGPRGTLVVPTYSGQNSEPAYWRDPPVPQPWWDTIRAAMPGFHVKVTPTHGMGAVAEVLRNWPVARRSNHPTASFAAIGPLADQLTERHPLSPMLGASSPLARIGPADGLVLLLGVGHDRNTSLHLAEYGAPGAALSARHGAAVSVQGERRWVTWPDLIFEHADFAALGAAYERTGAVRVGPVGHGTARLMPQTDLLRFAGAWFAQHRADPSRRAGAAAGP